MSFGLIYWIIMFLWLLSGVAWHQGWGPWGPWGLGVGGFILFLLLGWKVFGPPVHAALALPVFV